ncbi:MAG: hypothetical protein WD847_09260 [Pirellulales bacterium]
MPARRRTSRKQSDASSSAKPHEPIFFLDGCLGRFAVRSRLLDAGVRVEVLYDHFPADTPDKIWLRHVGGKGWTVLTKDRHIRANQVEIAALLESGVACFNLTAADMTGPEMGTAFVTALPAIRQFLKRFPAPFVAGVTRSGNVSMLCTRATLIKRIT